MVSTSPGQMAGSMLEPTTRSRASPNRPNTSTTSSTRELSVQGAMLLFMLTISCSLTIERPGANVTIERKGR